MTEKNSTTARMIPTQMNDCFYATLLVVAVTFYPRVGVYGRVLIISLFVGRVVCARACLRVSGSISYSRALTGDMTKL